jgi:hypothetical protein
MKSAARLVTLGDTQSMIDLFARNHTAQKVIYFPSKGMI